MKKLKDFTSESINVSELMTAKQMNEIKGGHPKKDGDYWCTNYLCTNHLCTNHLCTNSWSPF